MNKAMSAKIAAPDVKWTVYLYVIPHYLHEMYYVGITSNKLKDRWENGYGNNPELREAVREAGGVKKIGIYKLATVDDKTTAGQLESY